MKLTTVAATGGVGRQVMDQAVAAGHDVTAVVRRPDRLSAPVRAVATDLAAPDSAALADAVTGADAVLSGLGPRRRSEDGIASAGTRAVITAMRATGARRLVVVGVAGIATGPARDRGAGWFTRTVLSRIAWARLHEHYADIARMHQLLRDCDLDWTAVGCPLLTNQPGTGSYRVAYGRSVRGGWRIPRADVAHYMLRVLEQPDTINRIIGIAA